MLTNLSKFPAPYSPMGYALGLVSDGVLSIDGDGRIWRHAVVHSGRLRTVAARRAENVGGKGYLRVTIQQPNGRLASVMAHRLVWIHAHGPINEGMQINHKNLDKQDNRLVNLEVVSASGNIRHSYANGRPAPWQKATHYRGRRRIDTDGDRVARVIELRNSGMTFSQISEQTGISKSHVSRIFKKGVRGNAD